MKALHLKYFFTGLPHLFWEMFAYFNVIIAILVIAFTVYTARQRNKVKRKVDTDSDNFGGVKGSARWATDKEISAYWGKKRVKLKVRKIETK